MFAGARGDGESIAGTVRSDLTGRTTQPQSIVGPRRGVSRYSLTDEGPVPSIPEAYKQQAGLPARNSSLISMTSNDSLNSPTGSVNGMPVTYLSAFSDLRPNRSSMVSLQEAEFGWSSHVSGITEATKRQQSAKKFGGFSLSGVNSPKQQQPKLHRSTSSESALNVPNFNSKPPPRPYRPPFAPQVSHEDLDAVVPVLSGPSAPNGGRAVSPSTGNLNRGRSLKEKLQGVLTKSPNSRVVEIPNTLKEDDTALEEDAEKDADKTPTLGVQHFQPSREERDEGGLVGLARRISRKTIKRPSREPQDPGYTLPTQAELDAIPLFAAPEAANVPNAPMLSSYEPRPPLRPRSQSEGGSTTLKPTPSITVGAARLAYQKSLRQRHGRNKPEPPLPSAVGVASKDLDNKSAEGLASVPESESSSVHRRSRHPSESSTKSSASGRTGEDMLSMAPIAGNRNSSRPVSAYSGTGDKPKRKTRTAPEGWQSADVILNTASTSEAASPVDETKRSDV